MFVSMFGFEVFAGRPFGRRKEAPLLEFGRTPDGLECSFRNGYYIAVSLTRNNKRRDHGHRMEEDYQSDNNTSSSTGCGGGIQKGVQG